MWLVLDIGTTGVKAALLEASGRIVRSAYRDYPTHFPAETRVEQRPEDWWQAVTEAVLELHAQDAQAVALTGQMQDIILVDAEGRPVRSAILYSDARAGREAERLAETVGGERLRALTGNEQGASSVLAKLAWLEAREPASLEGATHLLLGAADFVAFKLSGVAATDTTTASTTGLLELESRTWLGVDEELPGRAERLLPTLVAGGTKIGTVGREAANLLGLRPGIPVHLGPGDAGTMTLGAGGNDPEHPYAYFGTSGWVAFSTQERPEMTTGAFALAHPDPARFICVAPLLTAGGNLDWWLEILEGSGHEEVIARALVRSPTSLIYLPYLNGERSPFSDPYARAAFVGLSAQHTRDDLARALLEGVAFAYRHALETLCHPAPRALSLTGGGTRSAAMCRLLADVLGIPVSTLADATHTGLKGALLAARGEDGIEPATLQTFRPGNTTSLYTQKYALFRETYPALRNLFRALGDLQALE